MTRATRRHGERNASFVKHNSGEKVTLTGCKVKRETAKAILVDIAGAEHWLPLSQIHDREAGPEGERIVVSQWIAKEKGLQV